MIDLSDKGREKYYKKFFEDVEKIKKAEFPDKNKYRLLNQVVTNLQIYERQREIYNNQLKMLWELKKNQLIVSEIEKENIGTNTFDTLKREDSIKKYSESLRKFSSSFKEDLEKIIQSDPKVRNIKFNPN